MTDGRLTIPNRCSVTIDAARGMGASLLIGMILCGCQPIKVPRNERMEKERRITVVKLTPSEDWWKRPLAKAMKSDGPVEILSSAKSAFTWVCGEARAAGSRRRFQRFIVKGEERVLLDSNTDAKAMDEAMVRDCAMEE